MVEFSTGWAAGIFAQFMDWMRAMTLADVVEIGGAINGVAGAWMLAIRFRYSSYGWIAYLLSNMFWLVFAISIDRKWLLIQTICFTGSSLVGVWNYVVVGRYPHLPVIGAASTSKSAM